MKLHYLLLVMLFLAGKLLAQGAEEYTLEECIEYALENQVRVNNSVLDTEIAQARVKEVRADGLPQINGSGSLSDNPELQRMFFQVNPQNPITEGLGQPGEVIATPNLFQLRSSGDASATISQLIFDGSYFVGLRAAKTYTELASERLTESKIATVEAVSKAYYLVLINEERLDLLYANIARVDSLLRQTNVLFEEGFAEQIDVFRLEVNFNNLLSERNRVQNLFQVSEILLKYQMGMPVTDSISLQGSIRDIEPGEIAVEENVEFSDRVEYRILETNKELQFLNMKRNQMAYLPRLSAFASGGYFTQATGFGELFNSSWYPYSRYGFSLNVPIFSGLARPYRVKQARLELEKVENDLENMENTILYQTKEAQVRLQNSLQTLKAQERNLELAKEVTRVANIRYQEGVGSNLELVEAETDYKEAQTNYFNALYDVMVAKIEYLKALGTLYN